MQVTYKGDYALKVILDLSLNFKKELVHIEDVAQRQDIPQNFLEQILLLLKKGGFVQSKKGPNGGYQLTRSPKTISLGEVVRFIEGPIYPISCVDPHGPQTCKETKRCAFIGVWKEVGDAISNIVDNINFEQMVEKTKKLREKEAINYFI
ncbi:MAG: Rrf2 family transcriptional regulator [Candidatus Margulisbacteria bacterium]|nr:Rrf2 family transcriptional regulator [Candidatus Margulisiibacteriota bacterium]